MYLKRIGVFVLFVLLVGCSTAQRPVDEPEQIPSKVPFKGTNVIYVDLPDSPEEARSSVNQQLRLLNYEIAEPRSSDQRVVTSPRTFGSGVGGSARYIVRVTPHPDGDGTRLKLWGQIVATRTPDTHSFEQYQTRKVYPRGDRLSTDWNAWLNMVEIAEGFSGGTVLYGQEDLQF